MPESISIPCARAQPEGLANGSRRVAQGKWGPTTDEQGARLGCILNGCQSSWGAGPFRGNNHGFRG